MWRNGSSKAPGYDQRRDSTCLVATYKADKNAQGNHGNMGRKASRPLLYGRIAKNWRRLKSKPGILGGKKDAQGELNPHTAKAGEIRRGPKKS